MRAFQPLDQDWRFFLGDVEGGEKNNCDDAKWRVLDLPHDWSVEGEYRRENPSGGSCAYLPTGVGWYRKVIDVPAEWLERRVVVHFDAAQRNSDVWINGQKLGTRSYGYISFSYELTAHLHAGKNVLAVRLDNSKQPAARWYTGSGLYAHVNLEVTDPLHLVEDGTFVSTPQVTDERATVRATSEVRNRRSESVKVIVRSEVMDQGKAVAGGEIQVTVGPGETTVATNDLSVEKPKRWSPDAPQRYTLVTRILRQGKEIDARSTSFGIRTIRWDGNTGFWLNDKNIKLQGMGMHYDAGGLGAAIPDEVLEARILQLKSIGCNAIRTGHTPFPPLFYDLCDKHGMMVVDEAFDGWKRKAAADYGATAFAEWWKRDLTDFVRRDRNHPCVVLWSIGNETGERDKLGMTKIVHQLDPTRATTGGQCLEGVDVAGFNGPGEAAGVLESFHNAHPDQPIVLTEEPHGYQTRGFYRTLTWWRDNNPEKRLSFPAYSTDEVFPREGDEQYASSYDNAIVRITNRQCWKRTRETPWISGQFRWAAFDYLGEASIMGRHWPARFWHPGVIDAAGFPKDLASFYQSQWTRADERAGTAMVHLLPHWSHPLVAKGMIIPVVAYSNCDEVELSLNGKLLGRQKRRELLDFVWQVPYEPGEITAVGYLAGKAVAKTSHRTAEASTRIALTVDEALATRRGDVATVDIAARDKWNELVPWAEDQIEFRLSGPARFLAFENGDPLDVSPHQVMSRKVFRGLARGYFSATGEDGPIELAAAGILGRRLFEKTATVTLVVTRLALRGELSPVPLAIHYTMNGSEPTPASQRYDDQPFTLDRPATVRMLVLREGKPWITSAANFTQGLPPVVDDPRFEKTAGANNATAGAFGGPRDAELVGAWSEGKRRLRFGADGRVYRAAAEEKDIAVAEWWYDFPNDPHEDPTSTGAGAIRWKDSGETVPMRLSSQEAKELIINPDGRKRRLRKESN
ncbi:MAG TPA: glycoside hydrolase family 2 TIM barrel-domain containing protein [Tepidisphaeraceae bacterium]